MQHSLTTAVSAKPVRSLGRAQGRDARDVASRAAASNGNGARPQLQPPYNVLVTGSTKGVGLSLAEKFLEAGDNVVLCSRSEDVVASKTKELTNRFGSGRVKGRACNVARANDVAGLAAFAQDSFGSVDLWINNAGSNAYKYDSLVNLTEADIAAIVETNVLGVMLCCREAIKVMRDQEAGGHIFNMDGAGADGNATPRFAAYGATKRSLAQLAKSIQAELKMLEIDNVGIHNLSPGMVTTDLLMTGADTPTAKFFINCLAEPPEVVADFLVPRIRKVPQEARTLVGGAGSGTYIKFLTKSKAYGQIFARLTTGARKNRFVPEE